MLFVNIIAFAVLKILHNLVSMQKFLLADNCRSKQNYEKCPMWPNLYFHEFSGTLDSFLKIRLVLEINMCKHTEKFHASKSCKYRSFYINFTVFRIEICGTLLKCFFARKRGLVHWYFWYGNGFSPWDPVFPKVFPAFQVHGQCTGPIFRRSHKDNPWFVSLKKYLRLDQRFGQILTFFRSSLSQLVYKKVALKISPN